jgi:formate hydrogenlyase subunit 6/NADH:ubiquinone oxidoreductase subunit I
MNERLVKCEDDVIGFVFPVYFWGLPRMVERFVTEMQMVNNDAYVFAVATYGGKVYGSLGRLKRLLKQKGVTLNYGVNLKSVENYIPSYKVNDSEAFRKSIDENISKIAYAINNRESNRIQIFTSLNKLIYSFYPDENSDRYFKVEAACTGCATCQKVCPADNITVKSGKPSFQHRREHCLACVHNCPLHAIDWKQKTQGKERYRNAGIALNDLISFNSEVSI